jgi:hypothetical protein
MSHRVKTAHDRRAIASVKTLVATNEPAVGFHAAVASDLLRYSRAAVVRVRLIRTAVITRRNLDPKSRNVEVFRVPKPIEVCIWVREVTEHVIEGAVLEHEHDQVFDPWFG